MGLQRSEVAQSKYLHPRLLAYLYRAILSRAHVYGSLLYNSCGRVRVGLRRLYYTLFYDTQKGILRKACFLYPSHEKKSFNQINFYTYKYILFFVCL